MASDPISRQDPRSASPSRRPVLRYVLLAVLFAAAVCYQVGSAILILQHGFHIPDFVPDSASAAVDVLDANASAAGLHRGDILVAIDSRPFLGLTC